MTNYDDFKKRIFENRPKVKETYDKLGPKYDAMIQIIRARANNKLTQKALAKKMNTKQSAIARLESGRANPSFKFIQRLAQALGTPITITFPG